jgi:hypothetical protein
LTAPTVEVLGLPEAAADYSRWAEQVAPAVARSGAEFGQHVAGQVAARVPVLSGQLAGSVESDVDDDGVAVGMGDGLDYAGWIEFGGTRGRPYIPEGRYLQPTAAAAADEWAATASAAAEDTVKRFSWSTPSS